MSDKHAGLKSEKFVNWGRAIEMKTMKNYEGLIEDTSVSKQHIRNQRFCRALVPLSSIVLVFSIHEK